MWLLTLIPLMTLLARMSGGGFGARYLNKRGAIDEATGLDKGGVIPFIGLTMLPEICFGLCFGWVAHRLGAGPWLSLACAAWSYRAMEMGHGNAYHDGMLQFAYPDRWQTLDYVVRPVCRAIMWLGVQFNRAWDWRPRSTWYCRLFMFAKGFLIGLPLVVMGVMLHAPLLIAAALLLGVLWATAYAISFRAMRRDSLPAELISGGFAGAVLFLVLVTHLPQPDATAAAFALLADAAWPWAAMSTVLFAA